MKIGVLGGGQLGQMLALASLPLGIKVNCIDASADVPAALVGAATAGDVNNAEELRQWARHADVITYEFENFPAALVADLSEQRPVFPGVKALAAAQDRWAEKRLFNDIGIPVPPIRTAFDENDIRNAIDELELPVVVKTRSGGYDGKGQVVMRDMDDLISAVGLAAHAPVIVEEFVPFDFEVSVIGVRGRDGSIGVYPVVRNEHRKGILHSSRVPSGLSVGLQREAADYMERLLTELQYVGVLALELFVRDGRLYGNEMAPRVHNSGHWTIEGADTSQFENHLRAVAGLPIGSTDLRCPTAMLNIVGAVPPTDEVMAVPGASLHLYGKSARPGRKLGHVTITAADDKILEDRIAQLESVIQNDLG